MKLAIVAALCLCVLAATTRAETNAVPVQPKGGENIGCIEVIGIMAVLGVASWVIIKLYSTCPQPNSYVDVWVYKSTDGKATWSCVSTNLHVQLLGQDPIELYRDHADDMAFFKARVIKSAQQIQ